MSDPPKAAFSCYHSLLHNRTLHTLFSFNLAWLLPCKSKYYINYLPIIIYIKHGYK